jgi:hypothetical protein
MVGYFGCFYKMLDQYPHHIRYNYMKTELLFIYLNALKVTVKFARATSTKVKDQRNIQL